MSGEGGQRLNTAAGAASEEPAAGGIDGTDLSIGYPAGRKSVVVCPQVRIPQGKISVLIGPNGSGKSTLLKAMARQLPLEKGVICLDRADVRSLTARQLARRLGILFQENVTPNDLTVEELAYYGRHPHRRLFDPLTPADQEAVENALRRSGADKLRGCLVNQLSSGQKQLAWIALLLAQSPDYLFLDEPTTFLDLAHQFEVMELVRSINRELGCTVVLSVHDLNLAAKYADYLLVVKEGAIVAHGAPLDVLTAERLRDVFEVETKVMLDEQTNTLYCLPLGRRVQISEGIHE